MHNREDAGMGHIIIVKIDENGEFVSSEIAG